MVVPIKVELWGMKFETSIDLETANKIACGLAGTAAGIAVMAAGTALRSNEAVKLGGSIAVTSVLGTVAAVGLDTEALSWLKTNA